jgi:hypothetical protein
MQRRREPAIASPDHADIGPDLAPEFRVVRHLARCRGIPAGGMDAGGVVG